MRKKQGELYKPDGTLLNTEQLDVTLSTSDRQAFSLAFSTHGLTVYVQLQATELVKLADRLLNAVGEA